MKWMCETGPRWVVARRAGLPGVADVAGLLAGARRSFVPVSRLFPLSLVVSVSLIAGCADETAVVHGEPGGDVVHRSAPLSAGADASDDTTSAGAIADRSSEASASPPGERIEGGLRVLSGSEALHAHAARQAEEDPAWGALLHEAERPAPASLNVPELAARMEADQRTRVLESPAGLQCSDPEIVEAQKRLVPHESDAVVAPAPPVPAERDVTRTLGLRRFAPLSEAQTEGLLVAVAQTCERLERDTTTGERAAARRGRLAEFAVRLEQGRR